LGNSTPSQLPYTHGQSSLFVDGDEATDASDERARDALEVLFPHSCRELNGDETDETIEARVDTVADIGRGQALPIDGLTQLEWP